MEPPRKKQCQKELLTDAREPAGPCVFDLADAPECLTRTLGRATDKETPSSPCAHESGLGAREEEGERFPPWEEPDDWRDDYEELEQAAEQEEAARNAKRHKACVP